MSKKCIFICIFKNILFLKLLYLLLESLYLYGNLDEDTHILIYTSTQFMEIIKTSKLYSNKMYMKLFAKSNRKITREDEGEYFESEVSKILSLNFIYIS